MHRPLSGIIDNILMAYLAVRHTVPSGRYCSKVTRRVLRVEQELPTVPGHMNSLSFLVGFVLLGR